MLDWSHFFCAAAHSPDKPCAAIDCSHIAAAFPPSVPDASDKATNTASCAPLARPFGLSAIVKHERAKSARSLLRPACAKFFANGTNAHSPDPAQPA